MILIAKGKFDRWRTPEGLTLLRGWARDGATDEALAKAMGISTATLYVWKSRFPDISEAIKKGKEVVDCEVENSLLRRALGYTYTEVRREESADGVKTTTTTKHVAPDVAAQIFWLKNRRPDKWREHPDGDNSNAMDKLDALLKEFRNATSER